MKLHAQRLLHFDNKCHRTASVASPRYGSICIDEAEDELVLWTAPRPCARRHEAIRSITP